MDSKAQGLPGNHSPYASIPGDTHGYPLRSLFERYRDQGGACWIAAEPPEMSGVEDKGEITCMVRCRFQIGHPLDKLYIGPAPFRHANPRQCITSVVSWVEESVNSGYLWCPDDSVKCEMTSDTGWTSKDMPVAPEVSKVLDQVNSLHYNPLRVSVVHSAVESEKISRSKVFSGMYPYPRTTVPSSGLFGTEHNNHAIDMSPFEDDKDPDVEQRSFRDEYVGYICPTYTSHSYEAGRSRRLACNVSVRLMSSATVVILDRVLQRMPERAGGDWTLWCMGQFCTVREAVVREVCILYNLSCMGSDAGIGVYLSIQRKICVISVSSGVISKKCSNGVWADSCSSYQSDSVPYLVNPVIDRAGKDFHRACLSSHFSFIPFVEHNAAIRTSISSAQILQAVCAPYCPATAAVSPVYLFSPLVTTPAYRRIMVEQDKSLDVASYMPGENVCVLYHNLDLNYEDSVIVSKRYADLGGFSTISTCRYALPPHDYVPEPGHRMCSVLSPWWKSPCPGGCTHTEQSGDDLVAVNTYSNPTGIVESKRILKSGIQSVRVRSFEQFRAGNKISTAHGQKGVASILMQPQDMPMCVTGDGSVIIPDMIIAVGSIVSRQTVGQVYESAAGIRRLRDPGYNWVIDADSVPEHLEEVEVYDGTTGLEYQTLVSDTPAPHGNTSLQQTTASIGYVRVFNQSQMTRERHFTSHRTMTSRTLRTPVKRSRGGAVRAGEMEVQAAIAAGLPNCVSELRRRGDEVVVHVCMRCQRLRLLHSCTVNCEFAELTLPYDTVVLDCVNKVVYNCTFKYTYTPDV